nr:MAG TPA: hypothetical protein [Caudoviricetes sp.]
MSSSLFSRWGGVAGGFLVAPPCCVGCLFFGV